MSVLGELKRRKIIQVIAVYAVVAWLVVQVITSIEHPLNLPTWTDTLVIVLLALGFPVMLVLSWAFNVTPSGLVRDGGHAETTKSSGRTIEFVLIGLVGVAVIWLIYRTEFAPQPPPEPVAVEETAPDVLPNSVAVLPFENFSPDPDNAFFAAGIHESILNELAKIEDMHVISRTAMRHYAEANTPIPQIAEELNVGTVMEGSVQYAEGRVLVTAQLIDPVTNAHIWSGNYDREFADIFAIQSDIATRIAGALQAELSPDERKSIAEEITSSPEAYALYLRAMTLAGWNMNGSSSTAEFHELLERAIVLDPNFAWAYATQAFAHAWHPKQQDLAIEYAEKSIALEPDLGLAYAAIGRVHWHHMRDDEARAAYDKAFELGPNDLDIIDDYGRVLERYGDFDRASELGQHIIELDPARAYLLGDILFNKGDYRGALDAYRMCVEFDQQSYSHRVFVAILEALLGNTKVATTEMSIARINEPTENLNWFPLAAYTYRMLDRPEEVDRLSRMYFEWRSQSPRASFDPSRAAYDHVRFGNYEAALEQLEIAATESENGYRHHSYLHLVTNAIKDPMLDTPEFVELRKRLGYRPNDE